jgi:hypothetical protein
MDGRQIIRSWERQTGKREESSEWGDAASQIQQSFFFT